MTRGQTKAAWIVGILAGVVGVGTVAYFVTKPKTTTDKSGNGSSTNGGTTLPQGPKGIYASSSAPSPYGYAAQGQPSFASYVAQSSTRIDPYSGNA